MEFSCHNCGKFFSKKSSLYNHKKTHKNYSYDFNEIFENIENDNEPISIHSTYNDIISIYEKDNEEINDENEEIIDEINEEINEEISEESSKKSNEESNKEVIMKK
ncbi:hypothetical protein Glove_64g3 [Diversispora epigaea]|uniref:C2H2-type domain-containing protein n=1 Tax=Diversispora epigaea TaxID=1348612 RepID=A0A397JK58_9GLOM|nr:hypothetical protein Glove_64g3 [Diversispora epigaea]